MEYLVVAKRDGDVFCITARDLCVHWYEVRDFGFEKSEYRMSLKELADGGDYIEDGDIWNSPLGEAQMMVDAITEDDFPSCPEEGTIRVGTCECVFDKPLAFNLDSAEFAKILRDVYRDERAVWDADIRSWKGSVNERHQAHVVDRLGLLMSVLEDLRANGKEACEQTSVN